MFWSHIEGEQYPSNKIELALKKYNKQDKIALMEKSQRISGNIKTFALP